MDSIQAEENLFHYLKSFSDYDGVSLGLIIGQASGQKGFVVHLAPTPEQSKETCLGNIKDFDEKGLGDHAKYVTRMLPGGLCIVGIFIVSNGEIFQTAGVPVLRKIIKAVDSQLKDEFGVEKRSSGNLVLLHFSPGRNELAVKRFDLDKLKNVNWAFKNTASTWLEIDTDFHMEEHFFEIKSQDCFADNLKNVLRNVVASFENLEFFIQFEKDDPKSCIESLVDKSSPDEPLTGQLHRMYTKTKPRELKVSDSPEQLLLAGCIPSKVFLHPRCTVEEAGDAVKLDILRSLAARFEMHWETLVDEVNGSPEEHERVHEPPRRVLIRPKDWKIMIADYVFPGEGPSEVIKSCKDLLDIDVDADDILETFEQSVDPYTMMETREPEFLEKSSSKQFVVLGGAIVLLMGIGLNYVFS